MIFGIAELCDGEARVPSGEIPPGFEVRIIIHPVPDFAGNTKLPEYVAPACRTIVSPGCALLRTFCRSPPAATFSTLPETDGYDVDKNTRGSSGGMDDW